MEEFSELKSARLLSIYARLLNGRVLKNVRALGGGAWQ